MSLQLSTPVQVDVSSLHYGNSPWKRGGFFRCEVMLQGHFPFSGWESLCKLEPLEEAALPWEENLVHAVTVKRNSEQT